MTHATVCYVLRHRFNWSLWDMSWYPFLNFPSVLPTQMSPNSMALLNNHFILVVHPVNGVRYYIFITMLFRNEQLNRHTQLRKKSVSIKKMAETLTTSIEAIRWAPAGSWSMFWVVSTWLNKSFDINDSLSIGGYVHFGTSKVWSTLWPHIWSTTRTAVSACLGRTGWSCCVCNDRGKYIYKCE